METEKWGAGNKQSLNKWWSFLTVTESMDDDSSVWTTSNWGTWSLQSPSGWNQSQTLNISVGRKSAWRWTSGGQTDTRRQHINAHAQKYDFRCPHTFGCCSLAVCNNSSCSSSSSITLSSEGYHRHPDPSSPPPPHTFCPHGSPQPRPQGSASTERSSNCRLVTKRITGPVGDSGQPKADYTGHYREGRRAKETRRCQRA